MRISRCASLTWLMGSWSTRENTTGSWWCTTGCRDWCHRSRGRRNNEVKEVKDVKEAKQKRDSHELTGAVRGHRARFSFAAEFKSQPAWNAPSEWRSMLRHYKRDVRIG